MKIVSWNINGLRSWCKKPNTLKFVTRSDIDILCLNETRIDESLIPSIESHFPDYPYKFWACSEKKGYAGVAVLSKHAPLSSKTGFSPEYDSVGRVLTLEFTHFTLVSTYFPNSGSTDEFLDEKEKFNEAFRHYLSDLLATGKELIVIGDMNIVHTPLDYFLPKGKKAVSVIEVKSFKEFLNLGLVDTFRHLNPSLKKFTWFNGRFPAHRVNNRGWRIDYALISKNAVAWVENSLIHSDVQGSDHVPIELILSISP